MSDDAGQATDTASKRPATARDLDWLAELLDSRFRIPGTNIRFGLDSLIGLVPGVGDGATGVIGLYLIMRAWGHGAPFLTILHMLWNMLLDMTLGAIPLLGDIFDVAFRSNVKNVRLLQKHIDKKRRKAERG